MNCPDHSISGIKTFFYECLLLKAIFLPARLRDRQSNGKKTKFGCNIYTFLWTQSNSIGILNFYTRILFGFFLYLLGNDCTSTLILLISMCCIFNIVCSIFFYSIISYFINKLSAYKFSTRNIQCWEAFYTYIHVVRYDKSQRAL